MYMYAVCQSKDSLCNLFKAISRVDDGECCAAHDGQA